jgi:hypothetical protein
MNPAKPIDARVRRIFTMNAAIPGAERAFAGLMIVHAPLSPNGSPTVPAYVRAALRQRKAAENEHSRTCDGCIRDNGGILHMGKFLGFVPAPDRTSLMACFAAFILPATALAAMPTPSTRIN